MPVKNNTHIICKTLAVKRIVHIGNVRYSSYALGLTYCDNCSQYFMQVEITCFCCNANLRLKPRERLAKDRYVRDIKNGSRKLVNNMKPRYCLSNADFEKDKLLRLANLKTVKRKHQDLATIWSKQARKKLVNSLDFKIDRFFNFIVRKEESQVKLIQRDRKNSRNKYRRKNLNGFRLFWLRVDKEIKLCH